MSDKKDKVVWWLELVKAVIAIIAGAIGGGATAGLL